MPATPPRASSRSRPGSPSGGGLADRFANVSLSTTDAGGRSLARALPADTSNVFLSRPAASGAHKSSSSFSSTRGRPEARESSTLALSQGMGGMSVADEEWIGKGLEPGLQPKRSASAGKLQSDRFIPHRQSSSSTSNLTAPALASSSNTPNDSFSNTSSSTIASALLSTDDSASHPESSSSSSSTRILAFAQAPPTASTAHDLGHAQLRRYTKLGPGANGAPGSSAGGGPGSKMDPKARKRAIPSVPSRVLDAPGMVDDYYLDLLAWSSDNMVGIGLSEAVYVWNAGSGGVMQLGDVTDESPQVTSLTWAGDGAYIAVGNERGEVEVWDAETQTKLRTMAGHASRVPVMSWHGHLLSSGCRDGSIHHHDVRVARHKVGELLGHTAEVCGLTWRSDGQILASGGNDNVVNCWDGRTSGSFMSTDSTTGAEAPRVNARWTKRNHTAAVKAIAWCPWQSSLLATGGGTNDHTIHFWSSTTGSRISSLPTPSQVTGLIFSPHSKEILSCHGFPDNNICLWSYPSLQQVWEVSAHDSRVLGSALSPDGSTVGTCASDENLKFWKIWDARPAGKSKGAGGGHDENEMLSGGGMKAQPSKIR